MTQYRNITLEMKELLEGSMTSIALISCKQSKNPHTFQIKWDTETLSDLPNGRDLTFAKSGIGGQANRFLAVCFSCFSVFPGSSQ